METSGTSTRNDLNMSSLWVLPADCIAQVLSYDIANGFLNLVLTGDTRMRNKLVRTKHLSLSWEKSGYVDWRAVVPLVSLLPKLESLRLTSSIPLMLGAGPPNAGIFSSSLRELILRYGGCAALLSRYHAPQLLNTLTVLESFDLYDTHPSQEPKVDLSHFPATLRSLRIGCAALLPENWTTLVWADFASIPQLPPQLETLDLQIKYRYEGFGELVVPWTSITDFGISLSNEHCIDIGAIGARLKRLRIDGGRIKYNSQDLWFDEDFPLRTYFPVLEALHMERYNLMDWNQLRNLPSTLVELTANIHLTLLSSNWSSQTLSQLNQEYIGRDGVPLFAAPMHFRRLESVGQEYRARISSALLVHFPLLLGKLTVTIKTKNRPLLDLPAINELCLNKVDVSSLESLPSSISSLKIEKWVKAVPLQQSRIPTAMVPSPTLPPLVRLDIHGDVPIGVISMLPSSLESLTFIAQDASWLSRLTQRSDAGELPQLVTLKLLNRAAYGIRKFQIDMTTIPSTLTTLNLKESGEFATDASQSLRQHFRLKNLKLAGNGLLEVLPSLPPTLRTLSVICPSHINIANPDDAIALLGMRQQLSQLRSFTSLRRWIHHVSAYNRPQITPMRWFTLPWSLKVLYARFYLVPSWLQKDSRIYSELFALSCLPRQLCVLDLPEHFSATHMRFASSLKELFHNMKNCAKTVAELLIKLQFPLLGPWLSPRYTFDRHHQVISALPPKISKLTIGSAHLAIQFDAYTRATGVYTHDYDGPISDNALLFGPAYYIGTTTAWILLALFFPQDWFGDRLLRYHMVTSALGSAVSAPIMLWQAYRAGIITSGNYRSIIRVNSPVLILVFIPFVVNLIVGFLLHNVEFLRLWAPMVALALLAFWFVSDL